MIYSCFFFCTKKENFRESLLIYYPPTDQRSAFFEEGIEIGSEGPGGESKGRRDQVRLRVDSRSE
jgi:hypothetical protein